MSVSLRKMSKKDWSAGLVIMRFVRAVGFELRQGGEVEELRKGCRQRNWYAENEICRWGFGQMGDGCVHMIRRIILVEAPDIFPVVE